MISTKKNNGLRIIKRLIKQLLNNDIDSIFHEPMHCEKTPMFINNDINFIVELPYHLKIISIFV